MTPEDKFKIAKHILKTTHFIVKFWNYCPNCQKKTEFIPNDDTTAKCLTCNSVYPM